MSVRYWHGGIPGLRVGELIEPGHERAIKDGCPICEARKAGTAAIDAPSAHADRIYITTDRLYAKHYASLYGRGDLYRVEPIGDLLRSTEDSYETYAVTSARVIAVYDRAVLLTNSERRRLYREWGQADLDHAAAQRVSGVSGGADERLSEYTGGEHETAPTGELVPHQPGPDRDSTPLTEGGIVAETTVPEADPNRLIHAQCACCGTRLTKKASDRNRMHFECWEEHHSDPGGSWPPGHQCRTPRSDD